MRKSLLFIFSLCLIVLSVSIFTFAASTCGEGVEWTLDEYGTLTVSGSGDMTDFASAEDTPWYDSRLDIREVIIEDGVTSLGDYAFDGCTSLEYITLSDGLKKLGKYSLSQTVLSYIELPEALEVIDTGAFKASAIPCIVFPSGLTTIGGSAFHSCTSLDSVAIPTTVTSLGTAVFKNCTALESAYIYAKLSSIPTQTFANCKYLADVAIPDSVKTISQKAFSGCRSLYGVSLPTHLEKIGDSAFENCTSLSYVGVPYGALSVGALAFSGCTTLDTAEIPETVTAIGENAFANCPTVVVKGKSGSYVEDYAESNSLTFENNRTVHATGEVDGITWRYYLDGTLEFSGTGAIPNYQSGKAPWHTYSKYTKLVIVNKGITVVGAYAFSNFTELTHVRLASSVTAIYAGAFRYCNSLFDLTLPQNLESISDEAFFSCRSLEKINIPAGVTSLGSNLFNICVSLSEINVDAENAVYSSADGVLYNKDKTLLIKYPENKGDASFVVPDTVKSLEDYSFAYLKTLVSVAFSDSLEAIGVSAFRLCEKLESVTLPDSVTFLGGYAFAECASLKSARLSSSLSVVPDYVFYECTALTSAVIPANAELIGYYSYGYCTSLESVEFNTRLKTIDLFAFVGCRKLQRAILNEGLEVIANSAFSRCETLRELYIPSSVTTINDSFSTCTSLEKITVHSDNTVYASDSNGVLYNKAMTTLIKYPAKAVMTSYVVPDGVEYIESYAFNSCAYLETAALPETLLSMGNNVFSYSKKLKTVSFPKSLKVIPNYVCYSCPEFESVVIHDGTTNIGNYAFGTCPKLLNVTVPKSVVTVSYGAFSAYSYFVISGFAGSGAEAYASENGITFEALEEASLESITVTPPAKTSYNVGETLDTTGMVVMANYSDGTAADVTAEAVVDTADLDAAGTISVTVTYDGKSAAFEVTVLELVEEDDNIASGSGVISWVISADGVLTVSGEGAIPDYTRSETAPWYEYRKSITSIVVSDTITSIGNYAFYNLSAATTITVPDSVKYVGTQFIRQTAIRKLSLPGVETIANSAFGRADALETLALSENVRDIRGSAFYAETLTVRAPKDSYAAKYVKFHDDKFPNSSAVLTLEVAGEAKVPIYKFDSAGDNAFYAIYQKSSTNWHIEISGFGKMKNYPYIAQKNIDLGYKFTPIYYLAQDGYETNIKSMAVLDGVTTVGNYMFYKCTKATSVALNDNVTSIGRGAFWACARLTSLTLPETVTTIGNQAFNGCTKLTSIYIPEGVTSIGESIFVKCNTSSLTVTTKSDKMISYIEKNYPEITIVSE